MSCYCEVCGARIDDPRHCRKVYIDSVVVMVCPSCYQKLVKQGRAKPFIEEKPIVKTVEKKDTKKTISKNMLEAMYEVVEDYYKRIKNAREKLGWSQAVLAQKLRVSENVIKRIEAGKLKPSIELARAMERLLGITLLEPVVEETYSFGESSEDSLTIGDVIKIKRDKEK